jgi:hypothetical protein
MMRLFLIRPVIVLLTFAIIASCEKATNSAESYPISNIDFAFFQASNKLYVSAQALKGYQGTSLDSILVLWNGTSATNTADTIRLLDDGTVGDMISKDGIISRKISNTSSTIKNVIPFTANDSVFLSILGLYSGKKLTVSSTFLLGNIRPKLGTVFVPGTVMRPIDNSDDNVTNTVEFSVTASVSDPNGLDDIKRVFFRSYHVGLDSMMYDGNPIFLYDDGTGVDGSGDLQKGDGTFTRTISITEDANTGTYHWSFEAQDLSNAYSEMVKKVLVVQ